MRNSKTYRNIKFFNFLFIRSQFLCHTFGFNKLRMLSENGATIIILKRNDDCNQNGSYDIRNECITFVFNISNKFISAVSNVFQISSDSILSVFTLCSRCDKRDSISWCNAFCSSGSTCIVIFIYFLMYLIYHLNQKTNYLIMLSLKFQTFWDHKCTMMLF